MLREGEREGERKKGGNRDRERYCRLLRQGEELRLARQAGRQEVKGKEITKRVIRRQGEGGGEGFGMQDARRQPGKTGKERQGRERR